MRNMDGKVIGIVGVAQDITERKKAEERLKKLTAELARSNKDLEEFAFVASHDLQEPLRKISGFTQLLKNDYAAVLDTTGLDYLARIQSAAARWTALIEGLLQYSRVTTKAQVYERVDLEVVIREVLSDLEVRIKESGAKVEVINLPVVRADKRQMYQLFLNLIGNALKFRKKDEPPRVVVQGRDIQKGFVKITVEDNGIA